MCDGILGDIFDLNNDGRVDALEQGIEFMAIQNALDQEEENSED